MIELLTIDHPFQTVDDFHQRAGKRLAALIHRLASKYPQLPGSCGAQRMLLALSVAWALTGLAKDGNQAAFEHIDEALSPPTSCGCVVAPRGGCVMVEGTPFFIAEGEQAMLRFLWDGFTIFIDHEGTESVGQPFFDFAECRQSEAYPVMGEEWEDSEAKSGERRAKKPNAEPDSSHALQRASSYAHPPTPDKQSDQGGTHCTSSRQYLAELVEGVATFGGEHEVKSLLTSFSYIPRHDDYIDRLRGILLSRLEELAAKQPAVAENHFHFARDVGQVIARGNGSLEVK